MSGSDGSDRGAAPPSGRRAPAGRGRCAACSTRCCRRTACSARPRWTRRGRSAPAASPAFPSSPSPAAPAAACPSRAPARRAGGSSAPSCADRPPPFEAARAALRYDAGVAAADPALQARRPDGVRRAARPAHGAGGRGAARRGRICWRRCRCIRAGCWRGATTRRRCSRRGWRVSRQAAHPGPPAPAPGRRRRSAKPARRSGRRWWPGPSPCRGAGRRGSPAGGCCWWTTC